MSTVRKVLDLFEKRERWGFVRIFGLTLLMAFVQTVGVASILPFISLVSNPEMITENRWAAWVYSIVGFESTRSFLLWSGVTVLALTAISNGLAAINHYVLVRFLAQRQYKLSVRLLRKYLDQPYIFHLHRNSANLAKNILAEVGEVINGVVMPGMKMLVNIILVICIFALLVLIDPNTALISVVVLGGTYGVIYTVIKRRQEWLGRIRRDANTRRFKAAGEALAAIKETKILGREANFLKRFSDPARLYSTTTAKNAVISDIPKYAIETIAFGGIILVLLYILNTQQDFGQAVAVVSLYALAGYRLMPALQIIFHGVARARFFAATLDHLHADVVRTPSFVVSATSSNRMGVEPLPFEREILIDRISFRYPGRDEWVSRDISLRIPKNTSIGLVGSTGSGKTTFVDIVLGLLEPDDGCVRVDDAPVTQENMLAWRRNLGYVPQQIFLSDDTVTRNIAFGVPENEIDLATVERVARIAHIHDFLMSLPDGYDTIVGERGVRLSGGQRQRVGIARALYRNPSLLILDEATSALDGITEDGVMEAINELSGQKTIILVAHRVSTLKDCDCIYVFERGQVVASGTYADLIAANPAFRALAKVGAEPVAH